MLGFKLGLDRKSKMYRIVVYSGSTFPASWVLNWMKASFLKEVHLKTIRDLKLETEARIGSQMPHVRR